MTMQKQYRDRALLGGVSYLAICLGAAKTVCVLKPHSSWRAVCAVTAQNNDLARILERLEDVLRERAGAAT